MTNIPTLLDLAPAKHKIIEIERGKIAVFPVSVSGIAEILGENPELISMFSGGSMKFKISDLAMKFPSAALSIAKRACRTFSDEEDEIIGGLDAGDILEIVLTAVELSMPGGVAGFLDRFATRFPAAQSEKLTHADPGLAAAMAESSVRSHKQRTRAQKSTASRA